MKIPIRYIRDAVVILDADYAFTEHGALMAANLLRGERSNGRSGVPPLKSRSQAAGRRFYFADCELGFHGRERIATYRVKRRRP